MGKVKEPKIELNKPNMQINYFVMRYMWQLIRGRSKTETIYNEFDMSRVRYTRILNAENVRYAQKELNRLVYITGLPESIFTGKSRFTFVNSKGEEIIAENTWKQWCEWREKKGKNRKQEALDEKLNEEPSNGKSTQDTICACLNEAAKQVEENAGSQNWEFYQLCYYLSEQKPAPKNDPELQIKRAKIAIQELSFETLDSCNVARLKELSNEMRKKYDLIKAIMTYKSAKTHK